MRGEKDEKLDSLEKPRYERAGSTRYILSALLFMNCFLLYAMRLNLSVSITAMVNTTSSDIMPSTNDSCRDPNAAPYLAVPGNGTTGGTFDWDQSEQAMITYSFFIGYLISQVPGGYMAERYSVTWVLGLGMGLTSLLTCFTSVAAHTHLYALLALRALEGLGEGVMFPSIFVFVSSWVPLQEQGFLLNLIVAGSSVGTVVTMPLSAWLCNSALGWPASFYVFGIFGVIFSALWLTFASDGPEYSRWITPAERDYIVHNRPPTSNRRVKSVPWKKILTSPAVLLLGIERLGGTLNFYMILTELPSYLKYMFGINIVDNGLINGFMNLGCAVALVVSGWAADKILASQKVSKNFIRKFSIALSCLVPSLCMAVIPQVGCRYDVILALIFVNCICLGMSGGGDGLVSLDIAPKYAGTIQGITNCMGNIAGVLAPQLVGYMTEHNNTLHQWNLVFYYTAIFTTVGATLFLVFGSTEEQEWAKDKYGEDDDEAALVQD